jgi:hypothetical protein
MTISHSRNWVTALAMVLICSSARSQEGHATSVLLSDPPARELELAIKSGDTCRLARTHYDLGDIPAPEIVALFEQCAKAGDARGTLWLARLYLKGRCRLQKNETMAQQLGAKSIKKVLELAKGGDREAQFLIGAAYQEGLGVERSYTEAAKWYTPAAAAGQSDAMNNLGAMYIRGYGVPADITKARTLLAGAAEKGFKDAARSLFEIQGGNRDDSARLKALFRAAVMHALGKPQSDGIKYLAKQGLISDPRKFEKKGKVKISWQLYFYEDGLSIFVDEITGRINSVEGYAAGYMGNSQFRGHCPLDITWSDTADTARRKLGYPNDSGDVDGDNAYGMAYAIDNLIYAVMFQYNDPKTLKVWRVYEKWVSDCRPLQDEKTIIPETGTGAAGPSNRKPRENPPASTTRDVPEGSEYHAGF